MLLAQVTHRYHDTGSDELADQRVPMKDLHEQFQQAVIEHQVERKGKKVTEQLNPPSQVGIYKDHEFHQGKTDHKIDAEGDEQCGDVRLEGEETEVQVFLFQDVLVADKINKQPDHRIGASANPITEGLLRHESPEGRVEEVDECDDFVFRHRKSYLLQ